jgi:hypothetical protein
VTESTGFTPPEPVPNEGEEERPLTGSEGAQADPDMSQAEPPEGELEAEAEPKAEPRGRVTAKKSDDD